jgi:quinol-cytochrome oxidoreductase complex cytochrome b subunit
MTAPSRTMAQDIGLFVVLALFANLIFAIFAGRASAEDLIDGFYLIAIVHILASLYDGVFDRIRSITWVILILGWTVAELLSFMRHVLPKGQLLFWLAANAPWAMSILEQLAMSPWILPSVLLGLLAIDVVFAHHGRWRTRQWSWLAAVIIVAAATGLLCGLALARFLPPREPEPATFAVVPSWHVLPYFSMMRSVPDKTAGLLIAFLAVLAPGVWQWTKPGSMVGAARWPWLIAWLTFVAAFLGLGYLGAQPPEAWVVLASQVLAVYYFAFLLIIPFAMRRLHSPVAG